MFLKFCDFLERRCNHPNRSYNLLTPLEMQSMAGYDLGKTIDVSAFEMQISKKPVLQTWEERLPENFVVLVRK